MPTAIVSTPGQVVMLPIPNDAPLPMAMTGWYGAPAFKSIVTGVAIAQRDGFRAVQSMNDLHYIYSFGRKGGEMRISGYAFNGGCNTGPVTGIEYVQAYYDTYSVSTYPSPLTVVLGVSGTGIHTGFLVGLDASIAQAETRLAQFNLQFFVLPRSTS